MDDIAVFYDGYHNEREFPPGFTQSLFDNYRRFCTGPRPFFRPYISIQHKDLPGVDDGRFGEVVNGKMRDGIMHLDADRIPEEIADLIEGGVLREPSIEFIEPKRDATGKPIDGFRDENGVIVDGPVMKCLSFLGNDIPGVKKLPPLPPVKFAARFGGGIVSKFRGATMDRAAMLQFLQEWGVNVSGFTDAVPDEVLKAMVDAIQAKNQNPAGGGGGGAGGPDPNAQLNQMADQLLAGLNPGAGGGAGGGNAMPVPTQIIHKFSAIIGGITTRANAAVVAVEKRAGDALNVVNKQLHGMKERAVNEFLDRMNTVGKVSPKMREGVKKSLMKCDAGNVVKFSHNDKKTGSELEEMFDFIEDTYPVQRDFNKGGGITQPNPKAPPVNPNAGNGGNRVLTPERRAMILSGSPQGQSVLDKARRAGTN